jgi:hypothetical protein
MAKVTNLDVKDIANTSLVELGVNLIKKELGTEVAIFDGLASGLFTGSLSVRGGKATIEAINEVGELPSIAVTSVQYILASAEVRKLVGGKDQPLKKVIGVATQGTRKMGKVEFLAKVAEGGSYSTLAKFVENLPAKEKAEGSPKVSDIDGAMAQFIKALEDLEDITPKDIEIAADFFKKVAAIQQSLRAAHPAVKAKTA